MPIWPRDHPRACGEHSPCATAVASDLGSSPRLRGTLTDEYGIQGRPGIIPALAGNTSKHSSRSSRRWDHPRACGEHVLVAFEHDLDRGSSPRLRGTPEHGQCGRRAAGIIPALAGNTDGHGSSKMRVWDHPRACGEHAVNDWMVGGFVGSSPRLRGTQRSWLFVNRSSGIIPALAGNTSYIFATLLVPWDHPRACGEHAFKHGKDVLDTGSSPRLRGTHHSNSTLVSDAGIIPALAGNTILFIRCRLIGWDHPRACGEHTAIALS